MSWVKCSGVSLKISPLLHSSILTSLLMLLSSVKRGIPPLDCNFFSSLSLAERAHRAVPFADCVITCNLRKSDANYRKAEKYRVCKPCPKLTLSYSGSIWLLKEDKDLNRVSDRKQDYG